MNIVIFAIFAFIIGILMVHAMMEFTISMLVKQPRAGRKPVDKADLRQRLMALNEANKPYRLVEGKDCDLELHWDVVDTSSYELFAKIILTVIYRARLLLDERRHEARWFEYLRSSSFFLGFDGWLPRLNWSFMVQSGFINVIWSGLAMAFSPVSLHELGKSTNST